MKAMIFQFQSFSDSVVMSTASTISGLIYLLYSASDLSLRLLSNGLLMRGAVAKGKLHHDKLVMFGPAFLTAYNIGTNIAKYPRVVLSPEFYEDYRRLRPGLKIPDVLLADDGPPYLNVFAGFRLLNEGYATPEYLNSDEVTFEAAPALLGSLRELEYHRQRGLVGEATLRSSRAMTDGSKCALYRVRNRYEDHGARLSGWDSFGPGVWCDHPGRGAPGARQWAGRRVR
jgi:hypothetical protein